MIHGFIDRSVNLIIGDISNLFCPPIQEYFEFFGNRCTIPGRRNLPRGNSNNADFLVGIYWPAQELLDSGFHVLWQFTGLLNRDISHGVPRLDRTKLGLPEKSANLGYVAPPMQRKILNPAPFVGVFLILTVLAGISLESEAVGNPVYIARRQRFCGDGDEDTIIHVQRGSLRINETIVERNELVNRLREIFERRSERLVYVRADPNISFRDGATVVDLARAEVDHIAILSPAVEKQSGCLTIHSPDLGK